MKDVAASIRQRLFNHARQHGDDFGRVLGRYAIERLLFRLSLTDAAERWVLKGAMLFATWPEHAFRPTGDLDLLGEGDPDPAVLAALFTRICAVNAPEDGIVFDPRTLKVEPAREADKYQGARVLVRGRLGSAVVPVQVDIGFGDHVYPAPTRAAFPNLLDGLPQASILMYPPETVVAEKFEAMLRFGEANGRIKDFYDIWLTARIFPFDLASLVLAVSGTLRRRGTPAPTAMPVGLTDAFAAVADQRGLWTGFLRRSPPTLDPPALARLLEELRRFFGPVIAALDRPEAAHGQWNPNAGVWR
ncbi:MAG TPA: nucleotidyl transferase AbiEii/AbiGii toxin family protein [Aquabacterium sp.]|nr:nucleotidyl transferase AbiEii/AbiGii toxin family protein [Aquabacterium sp.]HQC99403.1 nucleotidyl transferase AbiEii/AbiGii toxin family protein [Aquabacterium sp.]